ncbi:MAG: hypothetical protein AAF843_19805 [Bacteroidota bacterium]
MNRYRWLPILFLAIFFAFPSSAQEQTLDPLDSIQVDQLPEYIVILSENSRRVLGRRLTAINTKDSQHKKALDNLEDALSNKNRVGIQNQTDLLNTMSQLGFEYIDSFSVGSDADYIKFVFRKKAEFRD